MLNTDVKKLWRRYALAIGLLVASITTAHFISIDVIASEGNFASAINVAGRQRTLSQQILYFGQSLLTQPHNIAVQQNLIETISDFEAAHNGLSNGDVLGLQVGERLPDILYTAYFSAQSDGLTIDGRVRTFIANGKRLARGAPEEQRAALSAMEAVGTSLLLAELNTVVTAFEKHAQSAAQQSVSIANYSFAFALLVIVLEVIFIFVPANRTTVKAINDLEGAMEALKKVSEASEKSAEEALAAWKSALEAKQEADIANSAKSAFLSNISHEIRTPMNGVLLSLNLAQSTDKPEESSELLAMALNSAGSLLHLLNDLLDFSKLDAGKLEIKPRATNLEALFTEVRHLMSASAADKDLDLILHVSDDIPEFVLLDPERVKQIAHNFVSNAIKFTQAGQISVALQRLKTSVDDYIEISVTDTGDGISEDDQDRLFNRFTQLDNNTAAQKGTGLGLAICKQLAELMNGQVGMRSQLGSGSRFWLRVPCLPTAAPPTESEQITFGRKTAPQFKVLIAEDIPLNQVLIKKLMAKLGHTVEVVDDGHKVIPALEENRERPFDLILMDNQMPTMSGLSAITEVRASQAPYSDIPIVALTADAMKEQRQAFKDAGANGFVAKPIEQDKLKQEIYRVMLHSAS